MRLLEIGGTAELRVISGSSGGRRISVGVSAPILSPAQALVQQLLAYSPSLLLLGDLGTLQGDGTASVAGDGTSLSSNVATWRDQSGHGYDATQGTMTAQGRLLVAGAYGGRNAVLFDALDDGMVISLDLALGTTGYSIILAEIPKNLSAVYRTVQSTTHNTLISTGRGDGNGYYLDGGVYTGPATGTLGQMGVASLSCALTGTAQAHFNGENITDGYPPVEDWGGMLIGAASNRTEAANCLLGALVVVPCAARAAATSLLADYYGITLSA